MGLLTIVQTMMYSHMIASSIVIASISSILISIVTSILQVSYSFKLRFYLFKDFFR